MSAATDTAQVLSPWIEQQAIALLQQRGHAWLLQGPSGLGQQALGMALVQAWLCEQPQAHGLACGSCPSCHAISARTHADLYVLMPEVQALEVVITRPVNPKNTPILTGAVWLIILM